MRALFLVNVASGAGQGAKLLEELAQLRDAGAISADYFALDWGNLSLQIAAIENYATVIIAGGDGTFSSLLPTLAGSAARIALYPLGTGNDLAIELQHYSIWRHGIVSGLARLKELPLRSIRTWEVFDLGTGHLICTFVNYLSLGFSARVVYHFAHSRRFWQRFGRWGNRLGYLLLAFRYLFSRRIRDLTISSGPQDPSKDFAIKRARCILFQNISSIMGLGRRLHSSPSPQSKITCVRIATLASYFAMVIAKLCPLVRLWPTATGSTLGHEETWMVRGLPPGSYLQYDGEPIILDTTAIVIQQGPLVRTLIDVSKNAAK